VLIVFADAHWIDPTSQEALDLLVSRIRNLSALLVVTHRPEYEAAWPAQYRHLTGMRLARLAPSEGAELVTRVTGGRTLPPEVLDRIVAQTDGVPLFVEELTKSVIESGCCTRTAISSPGRAADACDPDIAARLVAGASRPSRAGEGHRADWRLHRTAVLVSTAGSHHHTQ
jgi:hypothetical protein